MTIVVLMFIFKVKTGRGGVKGYLKGVGIYGLPVLMFTLFEIGNSTLWIFGGHAGLYGSGLIYCSKCAFIYNGWNRGRIDVSIGCY